jgi:uncharacterized protein (DUF1501 family)
MSTRRIFLQQGLFATAGFALATQARMAEAATLSNRVVVFLYLFGGNDGLNTVVPIDQYSRYQALRPTLGIPQNKLLVLPDRPDIGLNPGLSKLYKLYTSSTSLKVAIINGVAMPKDAEGLFDHAGSQYVFQTCDTKQVNRTAAATGWFGRYFEAGGYTADLTGIDLGGNPLPLTGSSYIPASINSISEFYLTPTIDGNETSAQLAAYNDIMNIPTTGSVAEYNRTTRVTALAASATVRQGTSGYVTTPGVTYPNTGLGNSFKNCAQLLTGNLGIRAFTIGVGGWDTHKDQNKINTGSTIGYHDNLLQGISDCIDAFFKDLQSQGIADNVLLVTMSDFGRTAKENSDKGTDHGYSSVAFVVGTTVKTGVYNTYPDLNALAFDRTSLDIKSDFRSVYSTIASRFLGADPQVVTGGNFPLLGFL